MPVQANGAPHDDASGHVLDTSHASAGLPGRRLGVVDSDIANLKSRVDRLSQSLPKSPTSPGKSPGKSNQANEVLRLKARAEMLARKMDSTSRQVASLGRAHEVASWGGGDRKELFESFTKQSSPGSRGSKTSLSPKAADIGKFLPSSSSDSDENPSRSLDRHGLRKLRQKLQDSASWTPTTSRGGPFVR